MEKYQQRHWHQRKLDSNESPKSCDKFVCDCTTKTTKENKKGIFEDIPVSSESKVSDDSSLRRNRTAFTREQLEKLEEVFQREKYISRHKRCQLAIALNLHENTIKVWFQNRRMKSKRQRMAISLPHSYDLHTQAYLNAAAAASATPCTYALVQPPTSSPDASTPSLIHLPPQLYFAASAPNHISVSPSPVLSPASVNYHDFCLGQPLAPNLSACAELAVATSTSKIQYGDKDKMAVHDFLALNPSNINNGTAPLFVSPQATSFSLLQEHLQQQRDLHRHFYPYYSYGQQNVYKTFLAEDPSFSNGLYSLPRILPSHSVSRTPIGSNPIVLSSDNAGHVTTMRVNSSGSENERTSTLSDLEIVVDDENDADVSGNSMDNDNTDALNPEQESRLDLSFESKHPTPKCYTNRVRCIFRPF